MMQCATSCREHGGYLYTPFNDNNGRRRRTIESRVGRRTGGRGQEKESARATPVHIEKWNVYVLRHDTREKEMIKRLIKRITFPVCAKLGMARKYRNTSRTGGADKARR